MKAGLHPQRGMGIYGLISLLVLFAFLALVVMRLFPVYLNQFKIETHINEIASNPDTRHMSKKEIRTTISKRFEIDGVEYINVKDDIEIVVEGKRKEKTIRVNYEARVKLFYNLSIVGEFRDFEAKVVAP